MVEGQNLNLFDKMIEQKKDFAQQIELLQINFHRLNGAMQAIDHLIKEHEENLKKKLQDESNDGEITNDQETC
jgi:hypothetical protein